jgi:hypothetical protein
MTQDDFYAKLFAPLERELGRVDPVTLVAIVGFDAGGPLNFCTVGSRSRRRVAYVSCELAVRREQIPSDFGRYELLCSCDDEQWVRSHVSDIGRMSLEARFGHHHTLDIGPWVRPRDPIQGVLFEKVYATRIGRTSYGVLRCIGITRPEMELARGEGVPRLLSRLAKARVYPHTSVRRKSTA